MKSSASPKIKKPTENPPKKKKPLKFQDPPENLSSYFQNISKEPLLTREEEYKLALQAFNKKGKKADQAKKTLIERNLRFVITIAKKYQHKGLELTDLICEGNIGLMHAVEKFNPNMNTKLSTYSSWWIKQYILRAITYKSKTIRVPTHIMEKTLFLQKAVKNLEQELNRSPTNIEISEETGIPLANIQLLQEATLEFVPLDAPTFKEKNNGETLALQFHDQDAKDPTEETEKENWKEILGDLLQSLPQKEQIILKKRFGIDNHENQETLESISKGMNITRERVRQIQNIALKKLRKKIQSIEEGNYQLLKSLTKEPI